MSSAPPSSTPIDKKKKKKVKNQASESSTASDQPVTSSSIEDSDGLSRAIQTALDHAQAAGVIAASSEAPADLSTSAANSSKSKKRRAASTPNEAGSALDGSEQQKSKKKKTSNNSATASLSLQNTGQSNPTAAPNMSQLVPAYIPSNLNDPHIPIDPALTANDQMIQHHSHPQSPAPNAAFMGALATATAALQHQATDAPVSSPYIFNQDTDLSMLSSNEDILRALQGLDMTRFAGALNSLTSENPTVTPANAQSSEAGPSGVTGMGLANTSQPAAGPSSSSGNKPRPRKVVVPQPGSQIVNPEHADILATHWLNPAKLAELVKEQGELRRALRLCPVIDVEQALYTKRESFLPSKSIRSRQHCRTMLPPRT